MHEFIREVIQQRKKDQSFKSKTDLLSRFMSLSDEETGEPFADDYLIDVIMNFFIAGRGTTPETPTTTTTTMLTYTLPLHRYYCMSPNMDDLSALTESP